MSTLVLGEQGVGKTSFTANEAVNFADSFPDCAVVAFDQNGSLATEIIRIGLHRWGMEDVMRRVIYDRLGDPDTVIALPEFSRHYGDNMDEQVRRVISNYKLLFPELVARNPTMGDMAITGTGTNALRLCTAIRNEFGECWQVSEVKMLLTRDDLLQQMVKTFGGVVPTAKWYFENEYSSKTSSREKKMSRHAVIGVLDAIEPVEVRARVGYPKPSWIPKDIIEQGKILLLDASLLSNREPEMNYLVTQAFSLLMAEINKRMPHDSQALPILLLLEEISSLLSIPGWARPIGRLPSYQRSRKLMPVFIAQELAQFEDELKDHIWSCGNRIVFRLANHNDAYEVAKQIFPYEPQKVKKDAPADHQNPLMEPDRGQYLEIANWIQGLREREMVVQRHLTEQRQQPRLLCRIRGFRTVAALDRERP